MRNSFKNNRALAMIAGSLFAAPLTMADQGPDESEQPAPPLKVICVQGFYANDLEASINRRLAALEESHEVTSTSMSAKAPGGQTLLCASIKPTNANSK